MTKDAQAADKPLARRIGSEIRAEMARQDLSQEALAARVGRSQQWVSRRITGVIPVDASDIELIAAALNVPVHQLLPSPATGGAR